MASKHHPGWKINIKLGENRIGVLCSWNYLKVYWAEELKDRCLSMQTNMDILNVRVVLTFIKIKSTLDVYLYTEKNFEPFLTLQS